MSEKPSSTGGTASKKDIARQGILKSNLNYD